MDTAVVIGGADFAEGSFTDVEFVEGPGIGPKDVMVVGAVKGMS